MEGVIRRLTQLTSGLICSTCLARHSFASVSNDHLDNTGLGGNQPPFFSGCVTRGSRQAAARIKRKNALMSIHRGSPFCKRLSSRLAPCDTRVEISADINQRKSANQRTQQHWQRLVSEFISRMNYYFFLIRALF